jgi:hypothetical protein
MSTLIDHDQPGTPHDDGNSSRATGSADRPRRHRTRRALAAVVVCVAATGAVVVARSTDDRATPRSELPDLRGLDIAIYGNPQAGAADAAFEVPNFRGLDAVIYGGAPVIGWATDTSATWYWWPAPAGLEPRVPS